MAKYITLFVTFALIGTILEWAYGKLWSLVGVELWLYPTSPLHYTSFECAPLWGFGGLASIGIYKSQTERSIRHMPAIIIPLILAGLWVLAYSHIRG